MEKTSLKRWKTRISSRLESITDPNQRTILLATKITELDSWSAVQLFKGVITDNFIRRDRRSRILLEAWMLVLLGAHWQDDHRQMTLKTAVKRGERLISIFLGHVNSDLGDERQTFEIPDYGAGRPMTLGERRSLASKPNRRLIKLAIRDPHPMVVSKLLNNPKLTIDDVVFLSSKRPAPSAALSEVALHPKFRLQRRIARALINNPDLPVNIALTLLPILDLPYIATIASDPAIDELIREAAKEIQLLISSTR